MRVIGILSRQTNANLYHRNRVKSKDWLLRLNRDKIKQ